MDACSSADSRAPAGTSTLREDASHTVLVAGGIGSKGELPVLDV